jgi:hypothetical protein
MGREFVVLAAFFLEPEPRPLSVRVEVLDVHAGHSADASEAENHDGDDRTVAQADQCRGVDTVEEFAGVIGGQDGRLSTLHDVTRAAHGGRGVHRDDLSDDEVIEQHADGGEVLLYGRLGEALAEFFNVSSHDDRFEPFERETFPFAPGAELSNGASVCGASIPVANIGGEELDEAMRSVVAGGGDESRQGVGTEQFRWWADCLVLHGHNLV